MLVLLADHELNPSAFAARVAASTGASLAAAALAGLATLTGPRHGGAPAALEALLERASQIGPRAASNTTSMCCLRSVAVCFAGTSAAAVGFDKLGNMGVLYHGSRCWAAAPS